jgi:hypothetical protein
VQEQRGGAPGGTQLFVEPQILCVFPGHARAEKLRVDADQAPASGIQGPAIGGKRAVPPCKPIRIDDLARSASPSSVTFCVAHGWIGTDVFTSNDAAAR